MRQRKPKALSALAAATAALLAATLPVAPALAASPVTCGMTVTTDITLTGDLACPGPGLIVDADGITIDLAGHTLAGSDSGDTGIYVEGHSDLRIHRGTITGFRRAIDLNEVHDIALHGLRLTSNNPLPTRSATATLTIYSSQNIEILDSQLAGLGLADAIYAEFGSSIRATRLRITGRASWLSSQDVSVTRSTVSDGALSFQISTSQVEVRNNRLHRSAVYAAETARLTVANNHITGPVRAAVDVEYSYDTLIERNVIANVVRGVVVGLLPGRNTQIRNNLFAGNDYGVALDMPSILSMNTMIDSNRFIENRQAGVFIQNEAPSTSTGASTSITRNFFLRNGHGSTDTDADGRRIDDGIHINLPGDSPLTISDNRTYFNADHGIEALPAGSVIDGGGNRSIGDPNGCVGVTCT